MSQEELKIEYTGHDRIDVIRDEKSYQRQVIETKRYNDGSFVTCMRWETFKSIQL